MGINVVFDVASASGSWYSSRGVASVYVKPFMASLGTSFRAWWARGGAPRRRVEGEGASWLRTRISTVTTPSPNVAPLSTRTL